jgi:hypothetical protein
MRARPVGKVTAPVVTDRVADEATDLSGGRGDGQDDSQVEATLTGGDGCGRERRRSDRRNPRPGGGDSQEEEEFLSDVGQTDRRSDDQWGRMHQVSMPHGVVTPEFRGDVPSGCRHSWPERRSRPTIRPGGRTTTAPS